MEQASDRHCPHKLRFQRAGAESSVQAWRDWLVHHLEPMVQQPKSVPVPSKKSKPQLLPHLLDQYHSNPHWQQSQPDLQVAWRAHSALAQKAPCRAAVMLAQVAIFLSGQESAAGSSCIYRVLPETDLLHLVWYHLRTPYRSSSSLLMLHQWTAEVGVAQGFEVATAPDHLQIQAEGDLGKAEAAQPFDHRAVPRMAAVAQAQEMFQVAALLGRLDCFDASVRCWQKAVALQGDVYRAQIVQVILRVVDSEVHCLVFRHR